MAGRNEERMSELRHQQQMFSNWITPTALQIRDDSSQFSIRNGRCNGYSSESGIFDTISVYRLINHAPNISTNSLYFHLPCFILKNLVKFDCNSIFSWLHIKATMSLGERAVVIGRLGNCNTMTRTLGYSVRDGGCWHGVAVCQRQI